MADAIDAVIFDWGGTLTPWKTIDLAEEWAYVARLAAPGQGRRGHRGGLHQ